MRFEQIAEQLHIQLVVLDDEHGFYRLLGLRRIR